MAEQDKSQPPLELYDTINNKTFHGLLIAEFLAAFNDQCIHASAMFFAIQKQTMSEGTAISLMPLLFYSPWVIFAPLAGHLADKVSKRYSLIFWKVAEIFITGLALFGFWIGAGPNGSEIGPYIVLSCVFLMGTHSAFYVPNKYGVLPETFSVRSLSKANGLIESTTFLAIILGTAAGGWLSSPAMFKGREHYIGLILLGLACFGTITSLFIRKMPAVAPDRKFPGWWPWQFYAPLAANFRMLLRYRLAIVAVLGLAFFTFMVAYMRATMYMFGESQVPRWSELETSLFVAIVSLGVGIGSPLAGWLSGGKVELGLVPIGALGMVLALAVASVTIFSIPVLGVALATIGLFASFYLVPLYSLLQYSAPKGSKGVSVATNNFIASSGAAIASVLFGTLVAVSHSAEVTEKLSLKEQPALAGKLAEIKGERHHPEYIVLTLPDGSSKKLDVEIKGRGQKAEGVDVRIEDKAQEGQDVKVSTYRIRDLVTYHVRPAEQPTPTLYNNEILPRYLFLAAAILMFCILLVLISRSLDFPFRTAMWMSHLGAPFPRIISVEKLPQGPAVLVTNCSGFADSAYVGWTIVRPMGFIVTEADGAAGGGLRRSLARLAGMRFCSSGASPAELDQLAAGAKKKLDGGFQIVLNVGSSPDVAEGLLTRLKALAPEAPVVALGCHLPDAAAPRAPVKIVIGPTLPPEATVAEARNAALDVMAATGT